MNMGNRLTSLALRHVNTKEVKKTSAVLYSAKDMQSYSYYSLPRILILQSLQ